MGEVSKPFNLPQNGKAVVTAIGGIGTDGTAPDSQSGIPDNSIVTTSQIIVVTEVFYAFTPVVGFLDMDEQIECPTYFRPRLGSIQNIVAGGGTGHRC